jgi:exonuclease SbcD
MKKPIALILTDTHLKEDNIELVQSIWTQATTKCQELGIKTILFGGDFFTSRKAQSLTVLKAAQSIFESIKYCGIDLIGLSGNHDKVDATSTQSYLDVFEDYFKLLAKEYAYVQLSNDVVVHLIPYFKEDSEIFSDQLGKSIHGAVDVKSNSLDCINILLTHIAISGVKNNDFSVVENILQPNNFNHFDSVLIGHYHNQSKVGDHIYYIGSAFQANHGEDENKGFTILYDDGTHDFIQSTFPKYIQVKLDITDKYSIAEAEKKYANSPDHIRFVLTGEESELKNINKEQFSTLGIDVTFNKDSAVPLNNEGLIEKASQLSFDRGNIIKAFDTFCETKHLEDNSIGKTYLEKI